MRNKINDNVIRFFLRKRQGWACERQGGASEGQGGAPFHLGLAGALIHVCPTTFAIRILFNQCTVQ